MISKEQVKKEIDNVDSQYLDVIYKIIKALGASTENPDRIQPSENWHRFIDATYGCLADDPIERGSQGNYELREAFE